MMDKEYLGPILVLEVDLGWAACVEERMRQTHWAIDPGKDCAGSG